MKLKKIDIFIIKKFLGTYFFALILIFFIIVVFDFAEKIDDFLENKAPLKEIFFDYYVNLIPNYANLFAGLFVFISVIYFTSKMAYRTEIIAILSSGVSFKRMLYPYFLSATVIALLSLFLGLYIIPPANKTLYNFKDKYLRSPYRNTDRNIHKQIEPNVVVYLQSYNTNSDVGYKFSIEKFENGALKSKLISDFVKWNEKTGKWTIQNYHIRHFNDSVEIIEEGRKIDTLLNMYPDDFKIREDIIETMNINELNVFIEKSKLQGSENILIYSFDKYNRFLNPISIFILTLIGVSLSSRKIRGGLGMHIGLGLLLSFSYILFMRFTQMFAYNGLVSPAIAVLIPNFLYAIISLVLYKYAPK
ncbi:LptF/LptG family permease [Bacteroidota bacterium]